jgi:hypothetical protein
MAGWGKLRTTIAIAWALLTALACSSCNRGKTPYPVRMQVFFAGQPATGALVVLHPVDDTSPAAIRPSGYVDADGGLKLMSYNAATRTTGDGAPAGEYIVTIAWLPVDVKEYLSKHPTSQLPDKLQGRYSQPDSSTLRAKVLPQPTELPRIDLKKDGAALSASRPPISHLPLGSSLQFDLHRGGPSHA